MTGIKILGDGELKHGLTIEADKVSASAREKIEKAGGTVDVKRKPPRRARACGAQSATAKPNRSQRTSDRNRGEEEAPAKKPPRRRNRGKASARVYET